MFLSIFDVDLHVHYCLILYIFYMFLNVELLMLKRSIFCISNIRFDGKT